MQLARKLAGDVPKLPLVLGVTLAVAACGTPVDPHSHVAIGVPSTGTLGGRGGASVPVGDLAVVDAEGPANGVTPAVPSAYAPSVAQRAVYEAVRPKSVIDDQLYRRTTSEPIVLPDGRRGTATLVDLAPAIHVWFVLTLDLADGDSESWHLENPSGIHQRVSLDPKGLRLAREDGTSVCDLWTQTPDALDVAADSGDVYGALCDGALAVRNPTTGYKTPLEWTTDFLRDHVWGGEKITNAVKEVIVSQQVVPAVDLGEKAVYAPRSSGPVPAHLAADAKGRLLDAYELTLPADGEHHDQLVIGRWYPVHDVAGTWVSILEPRYLHPSVFAHNARSTYPLDDVEAGAFVYTVAFDLDDFDFGYEVGTDHPRVGWSKRVRPAMRDPSLPGPDGYDNVDPLVRTGMLDPAYLPRLAGVFVGGFKRDHGAFKSGPFAEVNHGSHYGFVEFGTELSRMQPGLATFVVDADGSVDLKTWTEADEQGLWHVRDARQNGVPLVETDPKTGRAHVGALVKSWSKGNWSGSVDKELRSMRSGVCIQDTPRGRYLLYSYFSSATPSAMADVFTGYGCRYAMLLDMNALEHTYLALTQRRAGQVRTRDLVRGMAYYDRQKGAFKPRFVDYADNRDFFYVLRKPGTAQ